MSWSARTRAYNTSSLRSQFRWRFHSHFKHVSSPLGPVRVLVLTGCAGDGGYQIPPGLGPYPCFGLRPKGGGAWIMGLGWPPNVPSKSRPLLRPGQTRGDDTKLCIAHHRYQKETLLIALLADAEATAYRKPSLCEASAIHDQKLFRPQQTFEGLHRYVPLSSTPIDDVPWCLSAFLL